MPEERNESIELGLPTVGAARAIQSRMHLLAASPLYNGNSVYKDWKIMMEQFLFQQSMIRNFGK